LESFANDSAYGGINLLKGEQTQTVQLGEKFGDSTFTVEGFHVEGASDVDDDGNVDSVDTTKIPDSWGDDGKADAAGYAFVVNSVQDPTNVTGIKSYSELTDSQSDYNDFNEQLSAAKTAIASGDQDAFDEAYSAAYTEAQSYATNLASDSAGITGLTIAWDGTATPPAYASTVTGTATTDETAQITAVVNSLNELQQYASATPTTAYPTGAQAGAGGTLNTAASEAIDDTQDALVAADPGTVSRVDWSDSVNYRTDLTSVLEGIEQVGDMLDTRAKLLSYDQSTISLREDYTSEFVLALEDGSDKLTSADMNEEAANLLALQTSQQLGVQGLSLANQQTQNILQILG
jgi:flagellin-like hook-associated protein FlgL